MSKATVIQFLDPGIDGLDSLLPDTREKERGFRYHSGDNLGGNLNIVVYGPPGAGKTILALQTAVTVCTSKAKDVVYDVIYLTKDTPAEVLYHRIHYVFGFFRRKKSTLEGCSFWALISDKDPDPFHNVHLLGDTNRKSGNHPGKPKGFKENLAKVSQSLFMFADFNEMGAAAAWKDRYQKTSLVFDAIGHLQPSLRPLFDEMANHPRYKQQNGGLNRALLVVCDSLRPEVIEEHLRFQPLFRAPGRSHEESQSHLNTVFLFVMESSELPDKMSVSYPPDVEIRMGFRDDHHGIRSRVLQLLKTRFQKSLDEETPFIICSETDASKHSSVSTLTKPDANKISWTPSTKHAQPFATRSPGITILPPIGQDISTTAGGQENVQQSIVGQEPPDPTDVKVAATRYGVPITAGAKKKNVQRSIERIVTFGIEGLDKFTTEQNLAGGGCTLLLTQNRCASTAISLHYLLAQIGESCAKTSREKVEALPRSVLYISLSGDVTEILHNIFQHTKLRESLTSVGGLEAQNIDALWREFHIQSLQTLSSESHASAFGNRLYSVPLRHIRPNSTAHLGPSLYVYVPGFRYLTPEEALDSVARILRFDCPQEESRRGVCTKCLHVDRVVFDRVGRLQSRWPLVKEHDVFLSGLAGLCRQQRSELMIVDDTAEAPSRPNSFNSRWAGIAQNIILLRRTPFHGSDAMTVELVRAAGRTVAVKRPYEIVFERDSGEWNTEMRVVDNFRGYTGLFTDQPRRCSLLVELSFDQKRTPLYREVLAAKQSIEASMDGIEIKLFGPGEWSGINSGYHHLSSVSRDACHIVAIDGIWLESLIDAGVLHVLTADDMLTILPPSMIADMASRLLVLDPGLNSRFKTTHEPNEHLDLKKHNDNEWIVRNSTRNNIEKVFKRQYVTRSLSAAIQSLAMELYAKARSEMTYAIPMRHNWGVMVVAIPDPQPIRHVFSTLCGLSSQPSNNLDERVTEKLAEVRKQYTRMPSDSTAGLDPKLIDRLVYALLVGQKNEFEEAVRRLPAKIVIPDTTVSQVCTKVFTTIWKPKDDTILLWRDLAVFRTMVWHPFWCGGWVEACLNACSSPLSSSPEKKAKPSLPSFVSSDLWITLFPRIDLFSMALTTTESIVSFFIELLLSETTFDHVFEDATPTAKGGVHLYRFTRANPHSDKTSGPSRGLLASVQHTLLLFCALLSRSQRRQVSIGSGAHQQDLGVIRPQRFIGSSDKDKTHFADWPTDIALFSRQWLTTIQDLLPRYDVRRSISLRHLPTGAGAATFWAKIPAQSASNSCIHGPPVAGPWYLGILKGGNTDLGGEIMHDILAEEHDMTCLLDRSGAPVRKQTYEMQHAGCSDLPYIRQVNDATPDGEDKQPAIAVPFDRNLIVNYLNVSPILHHMITETMQLSLTYEEGSGFLKPKDTFATEVWNIAKRHMGNAITLQSQ